MDVEWTGGAHGETLLAVYPGGTYPVSRLALELVTSNGEAVGAIVLTADDRIVRRFADLEGAMAGLREVDPVPLAKELEARP